MECWDVKKKTAINDIFNCLLDGLPRKKPRVINDSPALIQTAFKGRNWNALESSAARAVGFTEADEDRGENLLNILVLNIHVGNVWTRLLDVFLH